MSRRRYRLQLKELRARQDEERRRADALRAEHQAVVDRIEADRARPMSERAPPRVRSL